MLKLNDFPPLLQQDRYWGSLLFLFVNNAKLQSYLTPEFIDVDESVVEAKKLKKISRPWSNSEKFMLDLALHLFNEENPINLGDMDLLDSDNKQLAIKAIMKRFRIT